MNVKDLLEVIGILCCYDLLDRMTVVGSDVGVEIQFSRWWETSVTRDDEDRLLRLGCLMTDRGVRFVGLESGE